MLFLIIAAALWVGVHVGISGTSLRGRIVARIGETAFALAFTVVSLAVIALLVMAWRGAATVPVWFAPGWLRSVIAALMLPVFMVFACSLIGNPTAAGGAGLIARGPRGIQRVTRHPMLWSFAAWAMLHILGNGDTAAMLFFGAFLVTALAGMPSIDAKMARRHPQAWPGFAATTSILPFGAILGGRNRFMAREIGWVAPLAGALLWAAVLHGHRILFGVPVLIPG